jgi:protein phosphatase
VCDGLGGHAAGEVASSIASSTLKEVVGGSSELGEEVLRSGVEEAHQRILRHQQENPADQGMGTTVTSLWLPQGTPASAWIVHVGDSRIYVHRDQTLSQLSEDHSPVFRLYKKGLLNKWQMQHHPQKNLLERSLGIAPSVQADLFSASLSQEDLFLICTDGLTDSLSDEEIQSILLEYSVDEAADELVRGANTKGGLDNISLVLIQILKVGEGTSS